MKIKNVPVKVAASMLGKAEAVIRCGLAYGKLPFGVAVTTNPNKKPRPYYTYHISAEKFKEYTGYSDEEIIRYADKIGCPLKFDEE